MSRRSIISAVLLFAAMTTMLLTDVARGQDPAVKMEKGELQRAIALLENPEESKKLAEQLKIILKSQERAEPEKHLPRAKIPKNLFKAYQTVLARLRTTMKNIEAELQGLPFTPADFGAYIAREENREELLSLLIKLLMASLAASITWMGFRKLTRRLQGKIELKEPFTLWKRIRFALLSDFFKVYPWVCLYLFIYFLFSLVALPSQIQSISLYLLLAGLSYYTLRTLMYFLLSPELGERRVVPATDEMAGQMLLWSKWILTFALCMSFLIIPAVVLKRPALLTAFLGILRIGLFLFLAFIFMHWKERIGRAVCREPSDDEPYYRRSAKRICNYTAQRLYLVIIFYVGLILVLPVLGFPLITSFIVLSSAESVFVVVLTMGVLFLWNVLFARVIHWSSTLKDGYLDLEAHVQRYATFLKKFGSVAILIFAALTILNIWGLHAYEFIAANATLLQPLVRIPLIVIIALLLMNVTELLISRLERRVSSQMLARGKVSMIEVGKRVSTLGRIVSKVAFISIGLISVMMILEELGFDIKPILAGAGVLGLAVGFGAQNLVKDIISGLFLIVENRIRVGDVAIINGTGGLVEQVNPRTTVLRDTDGVVHVFPNGMITTLSNMTYEFSFYVFNIGVAYKEDTDRVIRVLREVGEEALQDEEIGPSILEPIEIIGVDQFADSAVMIKARIKTVPIRQWAVGREMNRRIKKRFDELGIEIPFPHRSFHFGTDSKPISVKIEGVPSSREELKQVVAEVLRESGLMMKSL